MTLLPLIASGIWLQVLTAYLFPILVSWKSKAIPETAIPSNKPGGRCATLDFDPTIDR